MCVCVCVYSKSLSNAATNGDLTYYACEIFCHTIGFLNLDLIIYFLSYHDTAKMLQCCVIFLSSLF